MANRLAAADDPRLTPPWAGFLRETSLDELPQLINVLRSEMSLVGPRPLYERQAEQWDERQRRRLLVKPGLTGYAQVYGRASLTIEEKIELDLYYVDNHGPLMDLRCLAGTLGGWCCRRRIRAATTACNESEKAAEAR